MVKKKPPKQQTLVKWFKQALRRPATLKVASLAVHLANLVARMYDWFR